MFLFSCTAVAQKDLTDVSEGESMPFIVYINYNDLFGAEHLCKLYLLKASFGEIVVEKRKQLQEKEIKALLKSDPDIQEADKSGFCIRMFDSH